MPRTATRTANVFTRIDPETKEQAEAILNQLGILSSDRLLNSKGLYSYP